MWDPCAPAPPVGCWLWLVQERGTALLSGMVRSGGCGRRWFPASLQLLQCAISRTAESGAGVKVGKEGRAPHTRVNSHFSAGVRAGLLFGCCGETPGEGSPAAEVDGTAELLPLTTSSSSCGGTYCSGLGPSLY